jgi:hypothetical protein
LPVVKLSKCGKGEVFTPKKCPVKQFLVINLEFEAEQVEFLGHKVIKTVSQYGLVSDGELLGLETHVNSEEGRDGSRHVTWRGYQPLPRPAPLHNKVNLVKWYVTCKRLPKLDMAEDPPDTCAHMHHGSTSY